MCECVRACVCMCVCVCVCVSKEQGGGGGVMRGRLQDNRMITAGVYEGPQHARSVLSRAAGSPGRHLNIVDGIDELITVLL